MPPMCGPTGTVEPRLVPAPRRGFRGPALVVLCTACSPQDGVVGAMAPDETDAGAGDAALNFETDFDANGAIWQERVVLPGGSVEFGAANASAADDNVAVLRFPGSAASEANDNVGPGYVTEIQTVQRFHFGTYRTRVQFGTCAPDEQVASAVLGYFSDGSDRDADGITDELEIDVQSLCGTPELLYLTVFTDYEVNTAGTERFEKLTRAIDFSTGDVYDTVSSQSEEFALTDTVAEFVRPGFPASDAFYEVGFDWHTDAIRFFIVLDGGELSLWTLNDPLRIPQQPVHFVYNLWHPESHWHPASGSADFPAQDVALVVDWLRIDAE